MKVSIVRPKPIRPKLPDPPFRVTLASRKDWDSLFVEYPELRDTHAWAGGGQPLEYNPKGNHRYFHKDGRIQFSVDVDSNHEHLPEVRWPA